jgi:hypothetical protein
MANKNKISDKNWTVEETKFQLWQMTCWSR